MGFFVEIMLTVSAWRKINDWKALLPMAINFFAQIGLSAVIGIRGGEAMNAWPLFLMLDGFCIITLIVMVAKPAKMEKLPSYKELKQLGQENTPRRAISTYGG